MHTLKLMIMLLFEKSKEPDFFLSLPYDFNYYQDVYATIRI